MYNTTEIFVIPSDPQSSQVEFEFWVEQVTVPKNKGKYKMITYAVSGGGGFFAIFASLLYLGGFQEMKKMMFTPSNKGSGEL